MKKNYIGTWLIEEMELWDKEFIDLVAPGKIKIEKDGTGSLSFGAVECWKGDVKLWIVQIR